MRHYPTRGEGQSSGSHEELFHTEWVSARLEVIRSQGVEANSGSHCLAGEEQLDFHSLAAEGPVGRPSAGGAASPGCSTRSPEPETAVDDWTPV